MDYEVGIVVETEEQTHVRKSLTLLSQEMRQCAGSIEARHKTGKAKKLADGIRKLEQRMVALANKLYFPDCD